MATKEGERERVGIVTAVVVNTTPKAFRCSGIVKSFSTCKQVTEWSFKTVIQNLRE